VQEHDRVALSDLHPDRSVYVDIASDAVKRYITLALESKIVSGLASIYWAFDWKSFC
jgi:hypothetical protein